MIAFYIMGLSTKTLRNALFVDLTNSIVEKTTVMTRTKTLRNAIFVDLTDSIVEKMTVITRTAIEEKVFWYFPIIPHLKRWVANKKESE
jgi:hypothetical protein